MRRSTDKDGQDGFNETMYLALVPRYLLQLLPTPSSFSTIALLGRPNKPSPVHASLEVQGWKESSFLGRISSLGQEEPVYFENSKFTR